MANKVVPILHKAPDWQPDRSDYAILWHGCTAFDKDAIEANGIDLTQCAVDTDFGRGFYTTTLERQARHWAWERFYDWRARKPTATGNQPVVLRFRVRRYSTGGDTPLDRGLDQLLSLQFVRGDYNNDEYWSLVQHCRQSVPGTVYDHKRPPTGWYDMVCGPVAAFWTQRVAMSDSDQFSFHAGGISLLQALIDRGKGNGTGGEGDSDYYRWFAVT